MTSAVKVGGERLYRKAHRGEEVERAGARGRGPPRRAARRADEGTATFEIECSSGTYVRTLIEELGDAYCEELRRTAIGPLRLADGGGGAPAVEELLAVPARASSSSRSEARLVRNGIRIPAPASRRRGRGRARSA